MRSLPVFIVMAMVLCQVHGAEAAPRASDLSGDLPRQVAADTGAVATAAAGAAAVVVKQAPIVGKHLDDDLMRQWVTAIGHIPQMWLEAGPAQLQSANASLRAIGFPAQTASRVVDRLDLMAGAAIRQLADPERLLRDAVTPPPPPSR